MPSILDIYNGAAVILGKDPVFTDPSKVASQSPTGQALVAAYKIVMPAALRRYRWNFCSHRALIPVAEDPPAFGWASAYELPSDCLRAWDINFVPGQPREAFVVERGRLLANITTPAQLRYIVNETDPAKFDAAFTEYLDIKLAAFVATKVTGSSQRELELEERAAGVLKEARTEDAQEADEPEDDQDGDLLDYRSRYA